MGVLQVLCRLSSQPPRARAVILQHPLPPSSTFHSPSFAMSSTSPCIRTPTVAPDGRPLRTWGALTHSRPARSPPALLCNLIKPPHLPLPQTVATLEPGAHFGGGARILGEGELQSCIKVRTRPLRCTAGCLAAVRTAFRMGPRRRGRQSQQLGQCPNTRAYRPLPTALARNSTARGKSLMRCLWV